MTPEPDEASARALADATEHHRAGRLDEARRGYTELLRADPSHSLALLRLGLVDLQQGHAHAALEGIMRAAALSPQDARIAFALGQAYDALERWPEAAESYGRASTLELDWTDAWLAAARSHWRAGQPQPAVRAFRTALALDPEARGAHGGLGAALCRLGDLHGAIEALREAIRREPTVAAHAVNLGMALCQQREYPAAEHHLRAALALEPGNADAEFNLGNVLQGLGRWSEAAEAFRRAVALRPDHADALNNLGNTLRDLGQAREARRAYEMACELRPGDVVPLNNLGGLFRALGQLDAAEIVLRQALDLDPSHPAVLDSLGSVLKDGGSLDEAIACYRRSLERDPHNAAVHGNLAYSLSFQSAEPGPILDECVRWNAAFAAPLARVEPAVPRDGSASGPTGLLEDGRGSPPARGRSSPAGDRAPPRRLRIGYVSGDFREHCQTLFTLPLFGHHDREAVEICCYSSVRRPDAYTERLAREATLWRDASRLDDASLARLIAADEIDVLVDLEMHMANGRPLVFARRPAPVQVAWLAYPGTTGLAAMDYRLSDARLDPDGWESHYTERTLRLDDTFWCYDPLCEPRPMTPPPALEKGHPTLGCLNNPGKITDRTLELWGAVLRAIPEARFKLLAPEGRPRRRLLERLAAQEVSAERVGFVPFRPRAEYLREYEDIDFCLDTLPYNGHTTSLDALWMGVPVVTRIGSTCAGRAGLSQLYHLELTELAAESDADFTSAALALAADPDRLAKLRAGLRSRMSRSPLMDAARFARAIERAYRTAWGVRIEEQRSG